MSSFDMMIDGEFEGYRSWIGYNNIGLMGMIKYSAELRS